MGEPVVPSDQNAVVQSFRARARFAGFALLAIGVVISAGISGAATTQAASATGLVAAYSFDEGLGRRSLTLRGMGIRGLFSNATWTTTSKFGGALSFNGSSARVNVPSSASLQLSSGMTLEAWVRPNAVSNAWRDVVYKGDDNYYLEATSTGGSAPAGGGTFGGRGDNVKGTAALATGTWAHIAVSYDGGAIRLYVNGAQVASVARTGAITTSTNQLQIGGDSIYGQYFNGLIDEVRVYNRALSVAEIQTDMSTPLGGGTADTTPPSAPGTLTATASSSTQVNLALGGGVGQRWGDRVSG